MKKVLFLFLITALVLSMAGCGLGGKTLYLPEKVEVYYDGKLDSVMTYQYNGDGFLTQILSERGENSATTAITCDKNGNVLSVQAQKRPDLAVAVGFAYDYTYSSRGNMLSETMTLNGQMENKTTWEYNTKYQATHAVHTDKQGNTVVYLYEYDKEGKLLAIYGNREEKQVSVTTFEYDEKGRMVLETLCNNRGAEVSKVEYRYEDGKTVAVWHRFDYNNMDITYVFDHAGNVVEVDYGENNTHIRYVYTYKEVKVSGNSPRRSYTGQPSLPTTGLTTLWQ